MEDGTFEFLRARKRLYEKQTIICVYVLYKETKTVSSDQIYRRAPILQNEMKNHKKKKRDFVSVVFFKNTGIEYDKRNSYYGRRNIDDDIENKS
jgi:hypothetical protein